MRRVARVPYRLFFPPLCAVVDEQNAHSEDAELTSPLEFRKDSEEENRDSEKDEDTKELEAVTCECFCLGNSERSRPAELSDAAH